MDTQAASPSPRSPRPALTTTLAVKDGVLLVRPITPNDGPALVEMIHKADPLDVRFRFHGAMPEPPPSLVRRLTNIDYDREMALVAVMDDEIVGVGRLVCEQGCETGEFALAVRSDQQRRGIGRGLMKLLIDYARSRGMDRMWGAIELENRRMLDLARELGFTGDGPAQFGELRMSLAL